MARGTDAHSFHPDLTRARLMPRTSATARNRRLLRALGRLGTGQPPRGGELVPLPDGAHLRVHWPTTTTAHGGLPAIVQIHGGGLIIGGPRGSDTLCRTLADSLGAVVASVGYRLPPEHPYPAPLDDCEAALNWLAEHPRVDRARIALTGDSAGDGHAAAVTARTVDAGRLTLAGQALMYPMLDDRTAHRPDRVPAHLDRRRHRRPVPRRGRCLRLVAAGSGHRVRARHDPGRLSRLRRRRTARAHRTGHCSTPH